MSSTSIALPAPAVHTRRLFLSGAGKATLSATAVALLAGCGTMAAQAAMSDAAQDVGILNVALGLEHEAINA